MTDTDTAISEEAFEAAMEAIDALIDPEAPFDFERSLVWVGEVVFHHGTLGDLLDDPALTQVQFAGPPNSTAGLLGHWSVERGDGGDVPAGYQMHKDECRTCAYLEAVVDLADDLDEQPCPDCGRGREHHTPAPETGEGSDGSPVAWCDVAWQRVELENNNAGDVDEDQVGESYCARWVAPMEGGKLFAVVTRTYYRVAREGEDPHMERVDEYLICADPRDPGGTEQWSEYEYTEVPPADPSRREPEDPADLADQSFAPEPGEWLEVAPDWAPPLKLAE